LCDSISHIYIEENNNGAFKLFQTYNGCLMQEEDTLHGDLASVDITTKENLNNLVKMGEQLLKKKFTRVNLDTGIRVTVPDKGTIEDELNR